MEYIKNNKTYEFRKNYQDDESLRLSMDLLTQKTFGISLENWYQKGFWSKKYMPYSLFYNNKAVASLLAIMFEFRIGNETKMYIQISTVMTDDEYRNQGLLKFIMDKVFEDWKMNCDGIYLYANDSVLEFYPRFGFVKENEYQFIIDINGKGEAVRKLDVFKSEDCELLLKLCKKSNPYAQIDMSKNYEIVMFHAMMNMKDNIYYVEKQDLIVIFEQKEDTLICYDIYGNTENQLSELLSDIADSNCKKAILLFTLSNTEQSTSELYEEEDTTLFVLKDRDNLFKNNKIILPLTYHA